ncbi:40S ribosomal protein S8 [Selaginella moellendorffii]|uniref:40S ribosomal protein S8 n=1 Tax=Selaginella moellendorffii TaxID=88036 RepID=UPI000D1C5DCA|nr:40S ribosomal protein S8 [Selaginella moellendorffii]|eukprot:XP_024541265.1 40S ribosomal protein S8 [Selaginella moellendorffii]
MTFAVATPMSGNTQTLVTSAIVQVDATPFRAWYNHHYGVDLSRKKKAAFSKKEGELLELCSVKQPARKRSQRASTRCESLPHPHLEEQMPSGRLLACIASRPGQCG